MTLQPLASTDDLDAYQSGNPDVLLAAADAFVRGYCGWHIAPVITDDEVVVYDGFANGVLMLPTLHLTAVTSVTVDDVAMDMTMLEWSPAGYINLLPTYWPMPWWWCTNLHHRRAATVVMTHGYATVPADLQAVVLAIASRAIDSVPAGNVKAMSVGQVSRTYATGADGLTLSIAMSELERAVLNRYRLPGSA